MPRSRFWVAGVGLVNSSPLAEVDWPPLKRSIGSCGVAPLAVMPSRSSGPNEKNGLPGDIALVGSVPGVWRLISNSGLSGLRCSALSTEGSSCWPRARSTMNW